MLNLLHEIARVFFGIVSIVTRAAPIAAAGAMAFTIGEYGVGKLAQLGFLLGAFKGSIEAEIQKELDALLAPKKKSPAKKKPA